MRLSASDLQILRQQPQSTELFLTIFRPTVAMSALVTGSLSRGAMTIGYYNVSEGSYLSIEAGMTLLVGTSAGARDLGKIRVRSASSSQLVVAENSHIDWSKATHLTVQRYWELFPIYPRIISDPNNNENVVFYKDYDIAYTNQNSILGAFPCAGNHKGIFTGENAYWSASGTYHLLGSALTYEWAFEGGTPTGSTSAVPGNVQYNTPGDYVTRLKVTGANGSIDTTYRYVTVRNNPRTSNTNIPIQNWEITNLSGSRAEGGYTCSITVRDANVVVNDGDVVIISADNWYGSNNISLGGNAHNNSKIFFTGHVIGKSISYNYKTGTVNFQVASLTDLMKKSEGFSVSVESKSSPSKWFELLDMDGRRAIYHFLKWHTTALSIADFAFVGQDQKVQFFDSDRTSLFDAVDNYMRNTLLGSFCSDRQGKMWAEVGAWSYPNPTGSFPPIQTLQKGDWIGDINVTETLYPSLSYLEMGGIAYSGSTTGTFDAFISASPGLTPNIRGVVERKQGLALSTQSQLNQLVGNQYANKIARFSSVDFEASGNFTNFDIAPQESLYLVVNPNDTNIGVELNHLFLLESLSWSYSSMNKIMRCTPSLIPLLNGVAGETITIPDIPDGGGYSDFGGGFNFGRFSGFPPLLGTLTNKPCGAWSGYGLAQFSDGLGGGGLPIVTGTYYNYGMSPITTGFGGVGLPITNGVYRVTVNLKIVEAEVSSMSDLAIEFSYFPDGVNERRIPVRLGTDSGVYGLGLSFTYDAMPRFGSIGFSFDGYPNAMDSYIVFDFHSMASLVY